MRAGFNLLLWTTHVREEHLPLLGRIKAAGYDGVEVPVFEGEPAHFRWLRGEIEAAGLAATAVGVVPDRMRSPIAEDARVREAGIGHLRWLVDCAEALGADVLCGPFHQPLGEFSGAGPSEAELARLAEAHRAMADHAAGSGVALAVEPLNRFECYILTTNAAAAAYVAAVGRANFGYLYDTFHSNIEERDPIGSIAATIGAIAHVHISENDRGAPGRGHLDLVGAVRALKAAGYDRWLTVEAFGQALPALAAATKVWRPLFDDPDQVVAGGIEVIRRGWGEGA